MSARVGSSVPSPLGDGLNPSVALVDRVPCAACWRYRRRRTPAHPTGLPYPPAADDRWQLFASSCAGAAGLLLPPDRSGMTRSLLASTWCTPKSWWLLGFVTGAGPGGQPSIGLGGYPLEAKSTSPRAGPARPLCPGTARPPSPVRCTLHQRDERGAAGPWHGRARRSERAHRRLPQPQRPRGHQPCGPARRDPPVRCRWEAASGSSGGVDGGQGELSPVRPEDASRY